jgi:hypothetical protein
VPAERARGLMAVCATAKEEAEEDPRAQAERVYFHISWGCL